MGKLSKIVFIGVAALAACAALLWLTTPDVRPLKDPRCNLTIEVRDWKGNYHPFVVGPGNPRYAPLRRISRYMRAAVVAGEDAKFYRHQGFDFKAMKEAAERDIEEGRFAAGGSTITQQLAKNLYLSRAKSLVRKVREAAVAYRLEKELTKRRILELYLNVVELGPNVYGVENGSRFYFGKSAAGLNPKEAAFLAAMLPGPKVYNPYKNLRKVERRSRRILKGMLWAGVIDRAGFAAWCAAQVNVKGMEKRIEAITGEKEETTLGPEDLQEDTEGLPPAGPEGAAPGSPEATPPAEGAPAAPGQAAPPALPEAAPAQPAAQ